MKRGIIFAAAMTLIIMTIYPIKASADADGTYEVRIEGVEKNENGEYEADFEDEIEVDGIRYIYQSASYLEDVIERETFSEDSREIYIEIVSTEGAEDEEASESEELVGEIPDFPETVKKDGVTYRLKDTKTETFTKKGREATLTMVAERNNTTEGPYEPTRKPETYLDPDTGYEKVLPEEYREALAYVKTETVSEEWGSGDYRGSFTIRGYEYTTFDFEGVNLPTRDDIPFGPEHYYLILQNQNLNPELYRITGISWSGPEYTDGETYYRDAAIVGDIYNVMCEDTYEGTISIPDIDYQIITAFYEESDKDYEARKTATAVVTYKKAEEQESGGEDAVTETEPESPVPEIEDPSGSFGQWLKNLFTTKKGLTTLGVAFAAVIVAITVVILISRRKKKTSDEGGEV